MADPNNVGPGSPSMSNPTGTPGRATASSAFAKYQQDTLTYLMGGKAAEAETAKATEETASATKEATKVAKEELAVQKSTASKTEKMIELLEEVEDNTKLSSQYLDKIIDLLIDAIDEIGHVRSALEEGNEEQKAAAEQAEKDKESSSDREVKPDAVKDGGGGRGSSKGGDVGGALKDVFSGLLKAFAVGGALDVLYHMWKDGAFDGIKSALGDVAKVGLRLGGIKLTGFISGIEKLFRLLEGPGAKAGGEAAARAAGKAALGGEAKTGARLAEEAAAHGGVRVASRAVGAVGRGVAKSLPGIGAALDAASAVDRFAQGDISGGFLDIASGALSFVPVVGTAASIGIQGYQAVRDISGDSGYEMGKGYSNIGKAVGIVPEDKPTMTGASNVTTADVPPGMTDYIAKKEGLRLNVYEDAGNLAIGYGHDFTTSEQLPGGFKIGGKPVNINFSDTKTPQISNDQAKQLLQDDLAKKYVPRAKIQLGDAVWNKLSDGQKTAIVDNVYNTGALTTKQVEAIKAGVSSGNMQAAASSLAHGIDTVHGKINAGLTARRQDEANLFASSSGPQATPTMAAPSAGAELAKAGAAAPSSPTINQTTVNNTTVGGGGGGGGGGGSVLLGGAYDSRKVHYGMS